VKRELLVGQLADKRRAILPAMAGLGGIIMPALIYYAVNAGDQAALQGWAIPTATDIAFALGVLALVTPGVPSGLKLFLMTLAIIDDLGAIMIIALFYSQNISLASLLVALISITGLSFLALKRELRIWPYLAWGIVLWISVLKSGVHATLAGVILGFYIPLGDHKSDDPKASPLRHLIHVLHPWVAFGILPLFAFVNAGVPLAGMTLATLWEPVPRGIELGLFFGKQVGVFGFAWLAVRLGVAALPERVNWGQIYGVSLLCGIGFTMSLFIGSLAFEETGGVGYGRPDRLGIIVGSLISGVFGYIVVKIFTRGDSVAGPDD